MNRELRTGLKVYKDYCAIKAHYAKPSYDYFLKKGFTKASASSYDKRHDKAFFEKLAKKRDYLNYIIANIAYNDYWIGDIVMCDVAHKNYNKWRRANKSLTYTLKQEIKKLDPKFKQNFVVTDTHPKLFMMYINGEISLETISILTILTKAHIYWDQELGEDPLWACHRNKIVKHERFLTYKKRDVVEIILDICDSW